MKRTLFASMLVALLLTLYPQSAFAAPAAQEPLCLPGSYPAGEDCLPFGSFGYFQHLADLGISLPLETVPATLVDPALAELDINYATVSTMDGGALLQRPVFASAADAAANVNPTSYIKAGSGAHYVTYTAIQEIDGKSYYFTDLGWMRRSDLTPVQVRKFGMGLQFSSTPERPFGWVLEFAGGETAPFDAYTTPGLRSSRTPSYLPAASVIEVFDIQQADGLSWYLIGPDMWLNSLQMRLVIPETQAPEGVDNGRWIDINLEQQSLAVYDNNQLVFATLIATGLDNLWTRPGLFQVYEKYETTTMSGDFSGGNGGYYYLADVPWAMYYDQARAIHGAYWRQKQFFGYQGSHGCVNLSLGDSRWVFDWANLGDWVYVHDPSGLTPTDDEFTYGAGAP